jgi:hypothetical protein
LAVHTVSGDSGTKGLVGERLDLWSYAPREATAMTMLNLAEIAAIAIAVVVIIVYARKHI